MAEKDPELGVGVLGVCLSHRFLPRPAARGVQYPGDFLVEWADFGVVVVSVPDVVSGCDEGLGFLGQVRDVAAHPAPWDEETRGLMEDRAKNLLPLRA